MFVIVVQSVPSGKNMKFTEENIDLGHFWCTNFWVPDPPPPNFECVPGVDLKEGGFGVLLLAGGLRGWRAAPVRAMGEGVAIADGG